MHNSRGFERQLICNILFMNVGNGRQIGSLFSPIAFSLILKHWLMIVKFHVAAQFVQCTMIPRLSSG